MMMAYRYVKERDFKLMSSPEFLINGINYENTEKCGEIYIKSGPRGT